ncbi:UDP-N-acetylglucosamine 4,6-dehydratase (inverting) [bacterium AH-315-M05]|nr:UDP-N-acetylglucosamine 4,6-dehydratase (inverting) [bacterium AH-315-M05]
MLNGKSILITGGTGSFGHKFVEIVLNKYPDIRRLVIFSRDELKQFEMAQIYSEEKYPAIRYFIGDVRDAERFKRACEGIDIIIHAAALKQVPVAEYNPIECIKTNVLGSENVINAALDSDVKKVVALSTDKAAAPINLYGATKLCSDKLFIAANNMKGSRDIVFSVVRYGNVIGSRGSVIPLFLKKRTEGVLPITHPDMTRFNITLEESVSLVLFAIDKSIGGEIFVPKIPSYKILDLAQAIGPECEHKIVGIRPGEKIHEDLITDTDSLNMIQTENCFLIAPNNPFESPEKNIQRYLDIYNGDRVKPGFKYNSGTNTDWLSVKQLRELIKKHIDPNFIH